MLVSVTDAGGLSSTATLTVDVTDVNEQPTISNLPNGTSITETTTGIISIYDVTASDPDGDVITFSFSSIPVSAPFTISGTGLIETTAVPNFDFETTSTYTLHVEVSDGSLSQSLDYVVRVTDVNEAPTLDNLPDTVTVSEDETVARGIFVTSVSDQDAGDTLTIAIVSMTPPGGPFLCDSASGK